MKMLNSQAIDCLVNEFDQEWSAKRTPSISDYLAKFENDSQRQIHDLLVELICVDLECRWKLSRLQESATKTIEDYVAEFSWLGPLGYVPLVLIQEEYRVRRQWGDAPDHESYARRFSNQNADVLRALALVDEELRREYPTSRPSAKNTATLEDMFESTRPSSGQTWLKYRDYMLHKMIGSGQMGKVYRATNTTTNDKVAVKFLRKSFCRDQAAVSRFLQEARTVSRLQHDGIVRVDGVGQTPGGGYFIVMEYLDGPDLATLVAAGAVQISEAVKWTIQAAEAVGYLNEAGIIHCDLKPGNLVLDRRRNVRVTDFGLARSVDEESGTVDRIAGTAPYMAPEQVCAWWGKIGPQTDAYALGAVLYCLLTGRAPFEGSTVTDVLSRVVSGTQPARPVALRPDIGEDLAAVVTKALTKAPEQRYHSALEFAAALRAIDRSSHYGC
jgi:predicted Ser/Thr protein kinase